MDKVCGFICVILTLAQNNLLFLINWSWKKDSELFALVLVRGK